ncbi:MAG: YicC family protein [Muribaculaceae bacterium]|nr:YicC family protein [Muribaculaceae bacterium]
MLMSMTGFGKAVALSNNRKITVELKSLNSKQLDLNVRIPYIFREHELDVRSFVGKALERGKADAVISVETLPGAPQPPVSNINIEVLAQYKKKFEEASAALGIPEPADWYSVLLRFPDATHAENIDTADTDDAKALMEAVAKATEALMAHRRAEGEELEKFFTARIKAIAELLASVEPYERERVVKIRQRLEDGLAKIPAVEYDKGRLEQELIFYIEKLDVNEEKQRLGKHLDYFMETMASSVPGQGKKLGFIAQEMGREINTLGSKSNHAEMQAIVVRMKDMLEQIKEQVLNVM